MQNHFRRSEPERPQHRSPKFPRGEICAISAQTQNLTTTWVIEGGPTSRLRREANSNPQPANPQSAQSLA
eukprot:2527928-Alexandrium_andersonii.AAC.1